MNGLIATEGIDYEGWDLLFSESIRYFSSRRLYDMSYISQNIYIP